MTAALKSLRSRREHARSIRRGLICESRLYSGPDLSAQCIYRATGYQSLNDIYVCGVHARGYLRVAPLIHKAAVS